MICDKCNGTGEIKYYHDAGDHFGAGTSPFSEWVTEKCTKCGGTGKLQEKESIQAAIRYSQKLDKEWNPPPPLMINMRPIIEHPNTTISSGIDQYGRRKILLTGDPEIFDDMLRILLDA